VWIEQHRSPALISGTPSSRVCTCTSQQARETTSPIDEQKT
jgi:hypothetical protein